MRNMEPTITQWVCTCCFVLHCNGDVCECCNPDDLLKYFAGFEPTAGMLREEHAEGCNPEDECDCETINFSWSRCDGCGGNLGGERHAMTGWIPVRNP